jgi:hypothetical protein
LFFRIPCDRIFFILNFWKEHAMTRLLGIVALRVPTRKKGKKGRKTIRVEAPIFARCRPYEAKVYVRRGQCFIIADEELRDLDYSVLRRFTGRFFVKGQKGIIRVSLKMEVGDWDIRVFHLERRSPEN